MLTGEQSEEQDEQVYPSVEQEIDKLNYEEVKDVIGRLKNGKALGYDGITADLLKNGGNMLWNRINKLIVNIWKKEEMPSEWKLGIINPMHKNGDRMNCNNYRAITLRSTTYNALSGVIYNRINIYMQKKYLVNINFKKQIYYRSFIYVMSNPLKKRLIKY